MYKMFLLIDKHNHLLDIEILFNLLEIIGNNNRDVIMMYLLNCIFEVEVDNSDLCPVSGGLLHNLKIEVHILPSLSILYQIVTGRQAAIFIAGNS